MNIHTEVGTQECRDVPATCYPMLASEVLLDVQCLLRMQLRASVMFMEV